MPNPNSDYSPTGLGWYWAQQERDQIRQMAETSARMEREAHQAQIDAAHRMEQQRFEAEQQRHWQEVALNGAVAQQYSQRPQQQPQQPAAAPAGWYPFDQAWQRYWDGRMWTTWFPLPPAGPPPQQPYQ